MVSAHDVDIFEEIVHPNYVKVKGKNEVSTACDADADANFDVNLPISLEVLVVVVKIAIKNIKAKRFWIDLKKTNICQETATFGG